MAVKAHLTAFVSSGNAIAGVRAHRMALVEAVAGVVVSKLLTHLEVAVDLPFTA